MLRIESWRETGFDDDDNRSTSDWYFDADEDDPAEVERFAARTIRAHGATRIASEISPDPEGNRYQYVMRFREPYDESRERFRVWLYASVHGFNTDQIKRICMLVGGEEEPARTRYDEPEEETAEELAEHAAYIALLEARIAVRTSPDDRFCAYCESLERIEDQFCGQCGALGHERWCKPCDRVEEVDSRFCGECGGPLKLLVR
jgi:DNA-binding transcriptional MerR regulator